MNKGMENLKSNQMKILELKNEKSEIEKTVRVFVSQWCPALCNPMDSSLPGSSVHGILQARTLEWVDIPFSRLKG